jgi:AcrR family transcriptional regulator
MVVATRVITLVGDTRQRIIETAAATFMRQGYAGAGMKQLTVDSAAPFGSLYHFFPGGKQELATETLRWAGAMYAARVGAVIASTDDVVRAMTAAFEAAARTLEETDYADACPIATVALEVASTNDELRAVTHEVFESWLDGAVMTFTRAGIRKKRARELAILFVAALEGGFLLSRAAKSTEPMRVLGRAVADAVRAAVPVTGDR